jgi:hypothetical protein
MNDTLTEDAGRRNTEETNKRKTADVRNATRDAGNNV